MAIPFATVSPILVSQGRQVIFQVIEGIRRRGHPGLGQSRPVSCDTARSVTPALSRSADGRVVCRDTGCGKAARHPGNKVDVRAQDRLVVNAERFFGSAWSSDPVGGEECGLSRPAYVKPMGNAGPRLRNDGAQLAPIGRRQ